MKTAVGYRLENQRKVSPHVVYWFDPPDQNGDQRRRTRTFKRRSVARSFQANMQSSIDQGDRVSLRSRHTLAKLVSDFKAIRLPTLGYDSRAAYQYTTRALLEHLGEDRLIDEIDSRVAESFIASLSRKDHAEISTWSRYLRLKHCRALFGAAVDWNWITKNPFRADGRMRTSSPLRVRPRSRPWHHVTPDEFVSLLAKIEAPQDRAICWLMYGCGLRPGEAVNVRLQVLDLAAQTVVVEDRVATRDRPPFKVKGATGEESKTRTLHIPDVAMVDISEAARQALAVDGFLCLSPRSFDLMRQRWARVQDRQPIDANGVPGWSNRHILTGVRNRIQRAVDRAQLELTAKLALTTFRKSFAQNHANAGTPPKTLSTLLGHSNVVITMTFYQCVTNESEIAAAATIDRLMAPANSVAEVFA